MASENEAFEEVAAHYRAVWQGCENVDASEYDGKDILRIVDRFESAWRREKAKLCECLKEAVDFHCGKCINKGGPCNKDCLFDRWNKALESSNAPVAEGGES